MAIVYRFKKPRTQYNRYVQPTPVNLRQEIAHIPDLNRDPGLHPNNPPIPPDLLLAPAHILPPDPDPILILNIAKIHRASHNPYNKQIDL